MTNKAENSLFPKTEEKCSHEWPLVIFCVSSSSTHHVLCKLPARVPSFPRSPRLFWWLKLFKQFYANRLLDSCANPNLVDQVIWFRGLRSLYQLMTSHLQKFISLLFCIRIFSANLWQPSLGIVVCINHDHATDHISIPCWCCRLGSGLLIRVIPKL